MAIYFDKAVVTVNNINLMADSATIDYSNTVVPLYSLGRRGSFIQAPQGSVKSNFNINYYVSTVKEPNFTIANQIRTGHSTFNYTSTQVAIAGITGQCYLESYNLKVQPNEPTKASVSYVAYSKLSGSLQSKSDGSPGSSGFSGAVSGFEGYSGATATTFDMNQLSHGWTTFISNITNYKDIPTYSFEYNLNAKWQPIYIIGNKYPIQMQLLGGQESLKLIRDVYKEVQFSGEELKNYLDVPDWDINLSNINYVRTSTVSSGIIIDISGAIIKNTNINFALDDIVKLETTAERFF